jgi:hypothetical protein
MYVCIYIYIYINIYICSRRQVGEMQENLKGGVGSRERDRQDECVKHADAEGDTYQTNALVREIQMQEERVSRSGGGGASGAGSGDEGRGVEEERVDAEELRVIELAMHTAASARRLVSMQVALLVQKYLRAGYKSTKTDSAEHAGRAESVAQVLGSLLALLVQKCKY